ncbi:MAG: helicase-related protein [Bacillota bacterium]
MVGALYFVYVAYTSTPKGGKSDGQAARAQRPARTRRLAHAQHTACAQRAAHTQRAALVQRASLARPHPVWEGGAPAGGLQHPVADPSPSLLVTRAPGSDGEPRPPGFLPPIVGVSHYPLLDLAILSEVGYDRLDVVKGPLPLALAECAAEREAARFGAAILGVPLNGAPGATPAAPNGGSGLACPVPGRRRLQYSYSRGPHMQLLQVSWRAWRAWRTSLRWTRRARRATTRAETGAATGAVTRRPNSDLGRHAPRAASVQDCAAVDIPPEDDVNAVLEALKGRILFDHEIRRALQERGCPVTGPLEDVLQVLILQGLVGRAPSVAIDRFGIARCTRCGSREIIEATCHSCGTDECLYCAECASMGQARSCKPLYFAPMQPHPSAAPVKQHPSGASSGAPDGSGAAGGLQTAGGLEETPNIAACRPSFPFELTRAQQDASRLLVEFVEADERRECLVFAVCGAGKTEVSFDAIACVLRGGGKALFAVPRSDVVAEVAPRVSAAFPGARIAALRGSTRERYRDADVVVATTHQVMRFYQAFDFVILDEADAFPYRGSRMLRHALRRATAPWGKTVYMTATPDLALLKKAEEAKIALIRISARHHGHPLPEPVVMKAHLPAIERHAADSAYRHHIEERKQPALPLEVVTIIEEAARLGHKVFVFVPTVELSSRVGAMLARAIGQECRSECQTGGRPRQGCGCKSEADPSRVRESGPDSEAQRGPEVSARDKQTRVAFVHSRHPERDLLREEFKAGRLDVLVTTTIMERGVTVPNADVVVLYADFESVFDVAALIQMAGRAGRSADYPCARVYFVAERLTPSMRAAVQSIRAMNRHAVESGYLAVTPEGKSAV